MSWRERSYGPGAAALTPKPRMLTDAAWQDGVKDEQLREIIVKGGAAVGKSPGMPSNPDLEKKRCSRFDSLRSDSWRCCLVVSARGRA